MSVLDRLAGDLRWETPNVINLMAREGSVEDIARCYTLYQSSWLRHAEGCLCILPEMWRTLLSSGRMQLFVVENRAKPLGSRIVSFSATVFATDEFCCEARSTLPPYLGEQMARHYLSHELPILDREQVAGPMLTTD